MGSYCNLQDPFLFRVTRLDCTKISARKCLSAYERSGKVLFFFSNVKTSGKPYEFKGTKLDSKFDKLTSGSPKLQEFCNENAATCRPSSLQFRHSYIIKNLVRRLSQPMTARLIKTARSLQILHEIGQILSHQPSRKELPPRYIVQEYFNWSKADT